MTEFLEKYHTRERLRQQAW